MDHTLFSGVATALVTPFLNNEINYPLVNRLLRFQLDAGVKTIVLAGTTGEAPALSDSEKISLFEYGKNCVGDGGFIIAGTGSNSTQHTIALSKAAEEVGADALLVVAPYYNKGNADGLYLHFASIAASVQIPIIIYNVPSRTGVDIPISVYQRLAMLDNIAGVKEATADITKIAKIRHACPHTFQIWSGNDDQIVPQISLGAKGVISVLSNIFPRETVLMTNAALDGDFDTAAALQCELMQIIELLFCEVNPIPVKYAMQHIGFDCGNGRLPLGQLSPQNMKKIDAYFRK